MTMCGEHSIVNDRRTYALVAPLRCKRWSCPDCAPLRQRELKRKARSGGPNTFITLTSRPKRGQTATQAAGELRDAWRTIVKRAKAEAKRDPKLRPEPSGLPLDPERHTRINGAMPRQVRLERGELPFLAVFELTEAGWPHLHILARSGWIDQDWLSVQMADLTASPVVFIERIYSPRKLAAYVAKYIAKDPQKFDGCKRYWSSHSFALVSAADDLTTEAEEGSWRIVYRQLDAVVTLMERQGWTATRHTYTTELRPP